MADQKLASKRVGIWIRVSTEDQAKGESPDHHEKRARFYAEAKGWTVVEVYHLEGVSGKHVGDHPDTRRMLADVATGRITGLIFSKLARLARSTRQLLDFADHFEKHGADLISLQESIDTSTPAGRLFYTMIAAMAQWEREEIASRVAASVPIRAKLGKSTGGAAPFGYQWKDGELVPHPTEAPVRRLMYELYAKHQRRRTVARLLNQAGHRTRRGARFSDTTVERLLQDPTAKGLRRTNYTRSLGEGKHWELKDESEWVYVPVEPVVSEELWDRCNAILAEQKRSRKPRAKHPTSLFAGVLFCGACGTKMYRPGRDRRYTCRTCKERIAPDDLEQVFSEQLRAFVFSPEEILAHLEAADQHLTERAELLTTLETERKRVASEMDKLYRLYLDGQISPDGFGSRNRPLEERARQLEDEIPTLAGEIDFLRLQLLSSNEIVSEAQDLYSRWTELTHEEKRSIIETITERITVSGREITIDLAYLPAASGATSSPSSQDACNSQRILRGSSPPSA